MDSEIVLAFLKFTGIGLSLGFGVLALLTKYRDDAGNITRWGRIALVGVFASSLVSAGAQSVELARSNEMRRNAERQTLAELEANKQLLTQINRGLNPLSDVRARFRLRVSLDHPDLQGFVKRFTESVKPLIRDWESQLSSTGAYPFVREIDGAHAGKWGRNGIETVTVSPRSPLFPSWDTEPFANVVFVTSHIRMYFYRKPIAIDDFSPGVWIRNDNRFEPDLTMGFGASNKARISLTYDPPTGQFGVEGEELSDSSLWGSSGRIISLLDLAGAQVFITVDHSSFEPPVVLDRGEDAPAIVIEKRAHPELGSVVLNVGSRQGLFFHPEKLIAHRSGSATVYEYRFPESLDAVIADLR